ncbi:Hypothetical predicted protein [Octopus vulgaris]|uniref:Uncharacterized protein n=1 Tax=Octopus vulgaris TaxID=6645 RepID=A0AA36FBI9_OCTVU|nr:Hypothetical predicted protein [Octopus vulgaris]
MVSPVKKELSKKKRSSSAIHPVPHGNGLPVPDTSTLVSFESDEESGEEEAEKDGSAGLQSGPPLEHIS